MQNPTLIATPFAENGDKNIIPDSVPAEPQNATMQAGFPPITQQKISQGGIPPERNDFNGILNTISQHTVFLNKGGRYGFDAEFANKIGGYEKGACLTLNDGTQVVSNIDANTNDPNVNMTGWVRPKISASSILDESGKTQQEINNAHNNSQVYFDVYSKGGDFTTEVNALITDLSSNGGGTIVFGNKKYQVDVSRSIQLKSNIYLKLSVNTVFEAIPNSLGSYAIVKAWNVNNVSICGGKIVGSKYQHLTPTGSYYVQRKSSTAFTAGQFIYQDRWGFEVLTGGTSGSSKIPVASTSAWDVGTTHADGSLSLRVVSKDGLGEWGMGLDLRSSNDINIENLVIEKCWGDGIYIGRSGSIVAAQPSVTGVYPYCQRVNFKNVTINDNRRQGVSVISLDDADWQDVVIKNTSGTAPEAGIDFEPNYPDERMRNIRIRGLVTENNVNFGVLVYLGANMSRLNPSFVAADWDNSSTNYTPEQLANLVTRFRGDDPSGTQVFGVDIDNWRSDKDGEGNFATRMGHNQFIKGYFNIRNSVIKSVNKNNANMGSNHADSVEFLFDNVTFQLYNPSSPAVMFRFTTSSNTQDMGNIRIENCNFQLLSGGSWSYFSPIYLADDAARVSFFRNITVKNCTMNRSSVYDQFLVRSLVPVKDFLYDDQYASSSCQVFGTGTHNQTYLKKVLTKQQSFTANQDVTVNALNSIGTNITFRNDVNNAYLLRVVFSAEVIINGFPKSGNTTVFPLAYGDELVVRPLTSTIFDVVSVTRSVIARRSTSTLNLSSTLIAANSSIFATVPGAFNVGDFVLASSPTLAAGLILNPVVLANGGCRVYITNTTAAPITWGGDISAKTV